MSMFTDIPTEFETDDGPLDDGVETAFEAEEDYVQHGEKIHRVTRVELLEDGGVHIVQRVPDQGLYDSLTLNGAVAHKLRLKLGAKSDE